MKIIPIKTVFNGEITSLEIKVNTFNAEDTDCILTGTFLDDNDQESKTLNYTLTEEEYTNWGTDNNYLFEIFGNYFEKQFKTKLEILED